MALDLDKINPAEHEFTGEELGELLLASIKQVKAGEIGKVRHIAVNEAVEARQKTGLSQSVFAEILGISVRTLQSWEQGKRSPSGPALTLLKIATRHPQALRELHS
ncbi:helix-turn-helix domain-containing protein [Lonepinella koalarum]|uniref:Putative transcriptional regulator n=1 Tax=Lonepinella koalarum TaxID=53417 RepID=A0A4R1KST6_9PAST|nr:helix-turn-helix domain-containing protein [Lonepinella koalarum]MDH2927218.1 transcriptional regulator [Lonepinella koalarum]TCK68112.1 putative transcriptional regulator [Lonepinella koalarum]TFJ89488.1 helix-turn-helix domain-containing protein [Lonepinella koalarum]TYG33476.1 helix-turn-helix domain-containing protein [Lonepinella koalarum]